MRNRNQKKEDDLENKLKRIETEVTRYEEELTQQREVAKTKKEKLERKRRKEQHWEMLKWIVAFIDENKDQWEEDKKQKKKEEKVEEFEKIRRKHVYRKKSRSGDEENSSRPETPMSHYLAPDFVGKILCWVSRTDNNVIIPKVPRQLQE